MKKYIASVTLIIILFSAILLVWFGRYGAILDSPPEKPVHKLPATGATIVDRSLDKYFGNYDAGFVLYDMQKRTYTVNSIAACEKRTSPCSTFKIVNSLIGLETGVLKDENTTFKWDGRKYGYESWNHDQTLASAFANSVVWYYRKVAAGVGEKRMQNCLDEMDYGNADISGGLTTFWLQSSLKISPLEQVLVLRDILEYNVPFSENNVDMVKRLMLQSKAGDWALYGKTGSGQTNGKAVNGWFAGFVEKSGQVYVFATNILAQDGIDGPKTRDITKRILSGKGLID